MVQGHKLDSSFQLIQYVFLHHATHGFFPSRPGSHAVLQIYYIILSAPVLCTNKIMCFAFPAFFEVGKLFGSMFQSSTDMLICKIFWFAFGLYSRCREPNTACLAMLQAFKFEHVFDVKRHHLNGVPDDYKPQVFAVTSIDVMSFQANLYGCTLYSGKNIF